MIPLGLAYLASYLKNKIACQIRLVDSEAQGLNYQLIKQSIESFEPNVVGITCPTPTMEHVFNLAKMIKTEISRSIIVVAGGIHPTALPQETIAYPFIDFVVRGEGEETFYELIKALSENKADFSSIQGICYKQNGLTITTPARPLIADIDTLPFPDRSLFDLSLYRSAPTKKVSDDPSGPILTSRGCAFNCIHCISQKCWGGVMRFRSKANVISEIEQCLENYDIREFNFFDDTFTLNQKRAMEICQAIIDKKLNISWVAFSRVNTISEALVKMMKRAGCKKISFGLESGSQNILDLMRKNATPQMGAAAVKLVAQNKILVHASFMFGNVGETETTIKQTLKFAKSLPLDNATFFITSPFPGTDLFTVAQNEGFVTPQTKWQEFAPLTNTSPVLVQKNVSKERLVYWQKKAFREFYLRPKYIMHKLKQLNSLETFKTFISGFKILLRIMIKKAS